MAITVIATLGFIFAGVPAASYAQGSGPMISFTNLSFSTTSNGIAMTYFPTGTTQIFARWNYNNVPRITTDIVLRREWYINGVLSIEKEDAWDSAWGADGYLTAISIQDFKAGLTPGYYHVVISLMYDYPAAQVTGDFVIADRPPTVVPSNTTPSFSNLTVSTSPTGPAMVNFPKFTPLVSVRWDYANIPIGAILQRDWSLNGQVFRTATEPWSGNWGSSGRLTHIALYDYENGLANGSYQLAVFLRDTPSVRATVNFTIGGDSSTGPFSNLTFSMSATGQAIAIFAHGTPEVFARWDFKNVSPESYLIRRWFRNGVMWLERRETWKYGLNGSVNNISIYDYDNGMLPGDYRLEISLEGFPNSLLVGYFTIQ